MSGECERFNEAHDRSSSCIHDAGRFTSELDNQRSLKKNKTKKTDLVPHTL